MLTLSVVGLLLGGAVAAPAPSPSAPTLIRRVHYGSYGLESHESSGVARNVTVGTPQQAMRALIDLNSPVVQVAVGNTSLFDPSQSTTFVDLNKTASVWVNGREVQAKQAQDNFHIGQEAGSGFPSYDISLVDVSQSTDDMALGPKWGASLGLGLNSSTPFVDAIARDWGDKKIGIYLEPYSAGGVVVANPSAEGWSKSGELFFGGLDSGRIVDEVTYHPVGVPNSWSVPFAGVGVNGTIENSDVNMTTYALLSTYGNYVAQLPLRQFSELRDALPTGSESSGGLSGRAVSNVTYAVPCDYDVTIQFKIGDKSHTLTPEQWRSSDPVTQKCEMNIRLWEKDYVELGAGFLRTVYTALDVEKRQVGFATPRFINTTSAGPQPQISSSTSTSGAGSHASASGTLYVAAAVVGLVSMVL